MQSNLSQFENSDSEHQPTDYYRESVRLYYYNCVLHQNLERVQQERNELKNRLSKFQAIEEQDSEIYLEDKRKRSRRSANEIARSYNCTVQHCNKSYGSEGSLMQHMKIKHGNQYLYGKDKQSISSDFSRAANRTEYYYLMLPLKIYSHYKYVCRVQSKSKTPQKGQQQTRNRSITYVNDQGLIKTINSSEQLLDWILIEQSKKKTDEQLPAIIAVPMPRDKIKIKVKRSLCPDNDRGIEISNYKDPNKIAVYQKLNIYGKFLEPTPIKKFEYNQTKTLETAISQLIESQNSQQIMNTSHDLQYQTVDREVSPIRINETMNDSLVFQQSDTNPYAEQSKINMIINRALKRQEILQNPVNASKSRIQQRARIHSYLDKQFKEAIQSLRTNQASPSKNQLVSKSQQIRRYPTTQSKNKVQLPVRREKEDYFSHKLESIFK